MGAALAIAFNDLRLLLRDRGAAFFTFVFPLMFALLFTFVFKGSDGGGGGSMKVALFDEDGGPAAGEFAGDIEKADGLKVSRVGSREEGIALVRKGDATAMIVVPKGFQEGADGMFSGRAMPVEAVVDPSRTAEAGLLTGKLNELAFSQMSKAFQDPFRMTGILGKARDQLGTFAAPGTARNSAFGKFYDGIDAVARELEAMSHDQAKTAGSASEPAEPKSAGGTVVGAATEPARGFKPVEVTITKLAASEDLGPRSSSDFAFPQGIAWALMSCVIGFSAGIASERRRGTLVRLTAAPLSRAQILAGKGLACFLTAVSVQILLIGIALAMGSRVGSWPMLTVAILSGSLGFVGMAMLLASFAKTEEGAGGAGRAVPMILAMIGGGTIPLFVMPPFMQKLSSVSPFKWSILAVEGGMWRGFTLADMALPCGILLGMGAVCFVIGVRRLRWE